MILSPGAGRSRRGLVLLCGLVPLPLVAVLALYRPVGFTRLDNAVYDAMLRSAAVRPPGNDIVIVDVDERSLSARGQWPWPRDLVGRLIASLRRMGATVVAMDIIFAEPDRSLPEVAGLGPDAALAGALRGGDVVLGYAMTFDSRTRPDAPCTLHPLGLALLQSADDTGHPPFFQARGAICSLPALGAASGFSGFLNAAPDADGILRRAPLLIQYDGRVYPSLALASVIAATRTRDLALSVANANSAVLLLGDRVVPLDGRSNLLLRYRGRKQTFPYVSAADILDGRAAGDAVRDKLVFVGTTALGTREVVATPLDTLFAGVEVQATIANNLLRQDFFYRGAAGAVIEALLTLGAGIPAALLLLKRGRAAALAGDALYAAVVWFGGIWLLSAGGAVISPLYPVLGLCVSFAAMTTAAVAVDRRRADAAGREKTAAQRLMVQSLLSLTETRDRETGRHSLRTQQYTRLLAERLSRNPAFAVDLTPERVELLALLAPLHDIGKVGVPDHILNKPGALTPEELALMRRHPTLGRDVIVRAERQVGVRDDAILSMAKDIVYTHHERWDGSGYPQGLRGTAIPIEGRVLAIVDVYDASVSRTLYRAPMSHEEAVRFISSQRGKHFDPDVVDAFLSVAAEFQRLSSVTSAA
jgi:CHASE2 domain-containing sensor protein